MKLEINISVHREDKSECFYVVAEEATIPNQYSPSLIFLEIKEPEITNKKIEYPFLCDAHNGRFLPMTIQVLKELDRLMSLGGVKKAF